MVMLDHLHAEAFLRQLLGELLDAGRIGIWGGSNWSVARFAEKRSRRSAAWWSSAHAAAAAACTKCGDAVPVAARNRRNAAIASAWPTMAPDLYPVIPDRFEQL